jgi:hypothetical protein
MGIGKLLLKEAIMTSARLGATCIRTEIKGDNWPSQALFKSMGFNFSPWKGFWKASMAPPLVTFGEHGTVNEKQVLPSAVPSVSHPHAEISSKFSPPKLRP